ncbi:hypothetical protein TNCV_4054681 [Trichonephila clavipes]|nr:hypothetical protein TNCV_4054681 [Trichonephila clavipes]
MTNLGLNTLIVVPCYCHHNDMESTEYHQPQHLPHHVAHHWLTHVLAETILLTVLLNDDNVGQKDTAVQSHWDSEAWKTKAEMGRLSGIRLWDYKAVFGQSTRA